MATQLYGLIGYPVTHSLSPYMHNAAFQACGIDARYGLFEIKPVELQAFLLHPDSEIVSDEGLNVRCGDIAGFNITIPHKVAAKNILEKRFAAAQTQGADVVNLCGAVNTALRKDGIIEYRNTDVAGFMASVKADLGFDVKDKNVLLIGCGGAGRAAAAGLVCAPGPVNKIYIYESDEMTVSIVRELFAHMKDKLVIISKDNIESAAEDSQLVVNATPLGMSAGDPSPLNRDFLRKDLFVYDVVYNRPTRLVKDAEEKGAPCCGGLGMLLYQGVEAWQFWTGKAAPVDIMRRALTDTLASRPEL